MPAKPRRTVARLFYLVGIALANIVKDPLIKKTLAEFGFGEKRLAECQKLFDTAKNSVQFKVSSSGLQKDKTSQVKKALKAARQACLNLSQIIKVAFRKEPALAESVGARGALPEKTAAFASYSEILFQSVMKTTQIRDRVAEYGYSVEKLKAEYGKVEAWAALDVEQEALKGASQMASRSKQQEVVALDEWYSEFVAVAKIALKPYPEAIEKLEIKERSVPAKRKKKGEATTAANPA